MFNLAIMSLELKILVLTKRYLCRHLCSWGIVPSLLKAVTTEVVDLL